MIILHTCFPTLLLLYFYQNQILLTMNVDSLKSELQQVLDNDVVLRKEFNELKRSLSDYRNQLIMRDEDCKRLQVTIDVLNTKLVVMERDNNNYKAELTSFKELRGTIKEQLQAKQDEIDARLGEIQSLKDDLNTIAAGYEQKIEELRSESSIELSKVHEDYVSQINEIKTVSQLKENAIKSELEARIGELSNGWIEREQNLIAGKESELNYIKSSYEQDINSLKTNYEAQLLKLSSGSREEIDSVVAAHQDSMNRRENEYNVKLENIESTYKTEITTLRSALEEQRSTLTNNFNHQIESLKSEFIAKETDLIASYEKEISELRMVSTTSTDEISNSFLQQISDLKSSHETILSETISIQENKISDLVRDYEEKLSFTLIHSNSQNSKLNDELERSQQQNESSLEKMRELTLTIDAKNSEVLSLTNQILDWELKLKTETEKFTNLTYEFEAFKQNASLTNGEQVNELTLQITSLNQSHSDYVNDLNLQIESLNSELKNLGLVVETTANNLAETESTLELKNSELENTLAQVRELENTISLGQQQLEEYKLEIQTSLKAETQNKETEFEKLPAENSNLISDIDAAQDKIDSQEAEISILKAELEEVRMHSTGKAADFRETLSNKNFQITNLEANIAALNQELALVKQENTTIQGQLQEVNLSSDQMSELKINYDNLLTEKNNLHVEINILQSTINELNLSFAALTKKLNESESEIETLKSSTNKTEEQEVFIDRLFKQIDGLNDERLTLLEEKEQMANQLLKMNEVVGNISQQVDSENINVNSLNNHRKNVILATNSVEASEKPQMKEQINDLVREIDKCIALLSA